MTDISRIWRPARLTSGAARAAGVTLLTVAAVAGTSLAPAAGASLRPAHSAAATAGQLHGVWGSPTGPRTLIEHWNGSAWSIAA